MTPSVLHTADAHLQQITDQRQCHDPVTASHATQVIALDVLTQLEVVDQHGRKAGGGAVDAAVGDQDVNLLRANSCRHSTT